MALSGSGSGLCPILGSWPASGPGYPTLGPSLHRDTSNLGWAGSLWGCQDALSAALGDSKVWTACLITPDEECMCTVPRSLGHQG